MIYFCGDDNRRALVRDPSCKVNGIDYLEVVDPPDEVVPKWGKEYRQRILRVYFVRQPTSVLKGLLQGLAPLNIRVGGGERVTGIKVAKLGYYEAELDYLEVEVDPRGDFSPYNLSLVQSDSLQPLQLFDQGKPLLDPQLTSVDFSFKVECGSKFDCRDARACRSEAAAAPEIDYLARDYTSLRQLLLDRLSKTLPGWRERNPADLGITLVELLAYVGDRLSYRQDAIATEAYLGTARQRVSVRRHARLLDYCMHDGCNARVWVQVRPRPEYSGVKLPRFVEQGDHGTWHLPGSEPPVPGSQVSVLRTQFATKADDPVVIPAEKLAQMAGSLKVFEPLHDVILFPEHNELLFHTWGSRECCLPKGALKATLAGHFPNLNPGDVLVFMEVADPKTGRRADADLRHRHAVRLTRVNGKLWSKDGRVDKSHAESLFDPVLLMANGDPTPITEIEWAPADALPFPLCLASMNEAGEKTLSVALGNMVLADHGMAIPEAEDLGAVPAPNPALAPVSAASQCAGWGGSDPQLTPPRFHPQLSRSPVTQAAAGPPVPESPRWSAASAFIWDMGKVQPEVRLGSDGIPWLPQRDLLSSDPFAPEFVVEIDNDGRAQLRFGDDENGMQPGSGDLFCAEYRVGNGSDGNIGAESLCHINDTVLFPLSDPALAYRAAVAIEAVSNPMPAQGGREPETLEQVRQYAPTAFRTNLRAVTPDDYAAFAEKHPEVQRAAATLRWTGSWHTVFLAVDRFGARSVDDYFKEELLRFLEPYRMAGQDIEVDGPQFVALELEIEVCVEAGYFGSDVEAALRDLLGSRIRRDGGRGFFHPDNFSFAKPVHLSTIYAAAQPVPGVGYLEITRLRRLGSSFPEVPASGTLEMGRLQIARLDHDPNFPDRGTLTIVTRGGR